MATKTKSKKANRGPRPLSNESLREVLSMVKGRIGGKTFEQLGEKYDMAPQSVIRRVGDLCYKVRKGVQPLNAEQKKLVQTLERERLISVNYAKYGRSDQRNG